MTPGELAAYRAGHSAGWASGYTAGWFDEWERCCNEHTTEHGLIEAAARRFLTLTTDDFHREEGAR